MSRHIVLIGLPGAGKTTAGRLAAESLKAPFVDLDALVERRMQMPVGRIFGEFGEAKFRQLEREAMVQALAAEPSLIAPGGGWAAQPGQLELAEPHALIVYLKCLAITAARRMAGGAARPMLAEGEGDPAERLRELLHDREPFYLRAAFEVKTDIGNARSVADEIVGIGRSHGGWAL